MGFFFSRFAGVAEEDTLLSYFSSRANPAGGKGRDRVG